MKLSSKELSTLREKVRLSLSEKRFLHTLGVEKAARKIAEFCLPDMKDELSVAALLHDIAKEYDTEALLRFIDEDGIILSDVDRLTAAALHSYAAPCVIKKYFPEYATKEILNACRNHTLGSADMSLFEEIIFIADYIEDGRSYDSCINVRDKLYSSFEIGNTALNIKNLEVDGTRTV